MIFQIGTTRNGVELSTLLCLIDSMDNNMSEVLNAYILNSRHKPIITMLEDIREGLMERLHKKIGKK